MNPLLDALLVAFVVLGAAGFLAAKLLPRRRGAKCGSGCCTTAAVKFPKQAP